MHTRISVGELMRCGEAALQTGPFGTQLKADEYVREGVPVINVRNVGFGDVRDDDLEFVTEAKAEQLHHHRLQRDDIVFGRKGAVERHGLITDAQEGWVQGSDCLRLRLRSARVDVRYLSYYLRTKAHGDWMHALCSFGATMASLNQDIVSRITFPLPPIEAQRRIAAILTAYDDLIFNNQRRIALLEAIAEEIFREWFVRMRFPGHARASWSKGRPTDWTESTLGVIAWCTMGQSPSSEFYNDRGEGLPFHQGVGTYGPRYPRHEVFCSEAGREARAGDILFSVRAPVGRLNIADTDMILGRGIAAMRHKERKNAFLYYMLRVAFAKEDVIGNGSIFNSVAKDELARFPVLVPTKDLVDRFEEIAGSIDAQLRVLYNSNEKLKHAYDALLPRLISGKLKVDHLDIRLPPSMRAEAEAVA
jgi:type I restriction enzyme S subunit